MRERNKSGLLNPAGALSPSTQPIAPPGCCARATPSRAGTCCPALRYRSPRSFVRRSPRVLPDGPNYQEIAARHEEAWLRRQIRVRRGVEVAQQLSEVSRREVVAQAPRKRVLEPVAQ